jgi:hypothetical protein
LNAPFSLKTREVVLIMEKEKGKASFLDYPTLIDLARSRQIRFLEARGLDTRKGVRFHKDGSEYIAVDSDLPVSERIRALGFLLENEPAVMAEKVGLKGEFSAGSSMTQVLTLCC